MSANLTKYLDHGYNGSLHISYDNPCLAILGDRFLIAKGFQPPGMATLRSLLVPFVPVTCTPKTGYAENPLADYVGGCKARAFQRSNIEVEY